MPEAEAVPEHLLAVQVALAAAVRVLLITAMALLELQILAAAVVVQLGTIPLEHKRAEQAVPALLLLAMRGRNSLLAALSRLLAVTPFILSRLRAHWLRLLRHRILLSQVAAVGARVLEVRQTEAAVARVVY